MLKRLAAGWPWAANQQWGKLDVSNGTVFTFPIAFNTRCIGACPLIIPDVGGYWEYLQIIRASALNTVIGCGGLTGGSAVYLSVKDCVVGAIGY